MREVHSITSENTVGGVVGVWCEAACRVRSVAVSLEPSGAEDGNGSWPACQGDDLELMYLHDKRWGSRGISTEQYCFESGGLHNSLPDVST